MDTQYDQKRFDAQAQAQWQKERTFTFNPEHQGPLFSIDTPPPTVSGSLHIGHMFSYTQTDIIAHYKRMSGFNVLYPFGFDDNGLATERFVEKKHSVTGYSMKRSEFIKLCLEQSQQSAQEFTHLWQRMGISADFSNTYSTIAPLAQKISQASFLALQKKGHIYRKEEPALYCTTCCTSVAQAELDDIEMPSHFNDIAFHAQDGSELIVATTRPELLYSCVALFFHPDDPRYTHLKNQTATVPLAGYQVPILTDTLVEPTKGTGLVMCCTFGDKNDIAWFKNYNLPYRQSVGFDGKWTPETGELAGLRVTAARQKTIELLQAAGALKNQRAITHPVNVHERCKKPIEYVVLKQWFLNILDNKQNFLDQADKVSWYPSFMKSRYRDWVEHLQWDWCLSRQRFYGIPFPVWHCLDCKKIILATDDMLPIDPQETAYNKPCPDCSSTNIKGDTDVMDTWNTSSLTPYICSQLMHPTEGNPFNSKFLKEFLPMSMRPQAHDIIRTWAFYTIIKAYLHDGTVPWKEIVISGHVLSSDRDKISKSQGNNPLEPEKLLAQYPADAIRYWTASGSLGQDVAFSENQLKIGLKLQTKLWNALRFVKEHIQNVKPVQPEQLGTLNQWIVHQASSTFVKYQECLERHEFGHALQAVERFFWQDFCDNYLELVKDQLFNSSNYTAETVAATQWTLHHVGLRLLQCFAPYMPHITEIMYQQVFNKTDSIHLTQFKDVQTEHTYPESVKTVELLIKIVAAIRRLKTEQQLSLKVPLTTLTIYSVDQAILKALVPHEQLLKGITKAELILYASGDSKKSQLQHINELWSAQLDLDHLNKEA